MLHISQLNELNGIVNDHYSETFVHNINEIFQYPESDICKTLENKNFQTLHTLRSGLMKSLHDAVSGFDNKVLKSRRTQKTIAKDIFNIGYSVVHKCAAPHLVHVFKREDLSGSQPDSDEEGDDETSDELHSSPSIPLSKFPDAPAYHSPPVCMDGCKKSRLMTPDMASCLICQQKFHPVCISSQDFTPNQGSWTCIKCRNIAADLQHIRSSVAMLHSMLQKQIDMSANIAGQLSKQIAECNELKEQNSKLQRKLIKHSGFDMAELFSDDSDSSSSDRDSDDEIKITGHLLIGDSMLRDAETKSDDLTINSISGAQFTDVTKRLKSLKTKYKVISIVCGTNDCATKSKEDKIVGHARKVVMAAKKKAETVQLCSVLPRLDQKVCITKIDSLNVQLKSLAEELNIIFINNDLNFRYRDNSPDEATLSPVDKLHLSTEGMNRLLKNLKVSEMSKVTMPRLQQRQNAPKMQTTRPTKEVRSNNRPSSGFGSATESLPVTSWTNVANAKPPPAPSAPSSPYQKRKVPFQGHKHPLSNFFPCNVDLYETNFASAEAAYQYRKALEYEEWDTAEEIQQTSRAIDAKRLGDDIVTDERWWEMRESIMMEVVTTKAQQCAEFRNTLLASEGNTLVEDTPHEFWGRGKQGKGSNRLGALLEHLRSNMPSASGPRNSRQREYFSPSAVPRKSQPHRHQYHRSASFKSISNDAGCGFCGERGHSSDVCGHGRPIKCRNCQGLRHKEKSCWYASQ